MFLILIPFTVDNPLNNIHSLKITIIILFADPTKNILLTTV